METRDKFRIGLVQMRMGEDDAANLDGAAALVEDAAERGADVVCLPELFASRYFCQKEDAALFDKAAPVPGPCTDRMADVARRRGVAVVAPVFERRASGVYHNSAAVLDADGSLAGIYRKMHIPDDPGYYEKFYFTPGDLGFKTFKVSAGRIGVLICWDQWFPEGARLTALQGASVLFYPTAIGWHPAEKQEFGREQQDAWITVQRGHAIANGVYVAAVNRVGHETQGHGPGVEFWGSSFVADPMGAIVARASADQEETLIVDIDLQRIETVRRNWPFLRDRRIDAYDDIDCRIIDPD